MIKNLKNKFLEGLLRIVYFENKTISTYRKTDLEIFILIKLENKHLLKKNNGEFKLISILVDSEDIGTKKPTDLVKSFVLNDLDKDISEVKKIEIIDYYRDLNCENRKLKDCLFFQVVFSNDSIKDGLKSKYRLLSLEDLKIECFTNRLNLFDYKLLIRSQIKD